MTENPAFPPPERRGPPVHPLLWAMAGLMIAIQALIEGAAAGWLPRIFDYVWVYTALAFFDVKFEAARAGLGMDPQLVWSMLTYAFVHGGWLHVLMNAAVFLALGHSISQAIGIWRTLAIFAITAVAGALVFALIAEAPGPLVGASGSVFGFLGVVCAWRWRQFRALGLSVAPVLRLMGGLVLINVVLAFGLIGLGGALAWEAHLGGFIAGWIMAQLWPAPLAEAFRADRPI